MTIEQTAKQLVASSFCCSAERIRLALEGALVISNSRMPSNPPISNSEVIGLCGQSGRHPFFRVPKSTLRTTVNEIIGTQGDPNAIEAIAMSCQRLRQQTYFDSNTTCTNDAIPSLVPLLPPEEIWCDNRELPLDVWRLISFEYDLVSSAVASEVFVDDFAFGTFTQAALAFRYLMSQMDNLRIRFVIRKEALPPDFDALVASTPYIEVEASRLFFEAGALLTPLSDQLITRWYPAFRYMNWISPTDAEFRVRSKFDDDRVDTRYRGLFSEEMAIGMMAITLSDVFGAGPINNTVEVAPPGSIQPNTTIADFIALAKVPSTNAPLTIIAESKGSLRQIVSATRRKRAKEQVSSTDAVFMGSTATLPLVFCSTIYFSGQTKTTHCVVSDPPSEAQGDSVVIDPVVAWRVAYAKVLRFVGLEVASRQVRRGEAAQGLRPIDIGRDIKRDDRDVRRSHRADAAREKYDAEIVLDAGKCGFSIDTGILRILNDGITPDTVGGLRSRVDQRRQSRKSDRSESSFINSLGVGCMYYSDLDGSRRR